VLSLWNETLADPEIEVYVAEVDGEPAGWTLEGNHGARRFYERRGWELTDETRVVPYPPNPIDVQYAKDL
jgi:hypothetical protein